MRNSDWQAAGGIAGAIVGVILVVLAVVCLIAIWAFVRAVNLILRVLARYPRACGLVWTNVLCAAFTLTAAVTLASLPLLITGAALFVLAVLLARIIELRHEENFEREGGLRVLSQDVLHHWWQEVA